MPESDPANRFVLICTFIVAVALGTIQTWAAQCPSFTHMDDVAIVDRGTVPAGFYVFGKSPQTGLYRSLTNSYHLQLVPGTVVDIVVHRYL